MGKKISWETAERCGIKNKNGLIYCSDNRYGYKININNPWVRPFYERYKESVGERILSDRQRLEFEAAIFTMLERGKNRVEQGHVNGTSDR